MILSVSVIGVDGMPTAVDQLYDEGELYRWCCISALSSDSSEGTRARRSLCRLILDRPGVFRIEELPQEDDGGDQDGEFHQA